MRIAVTGTAHIGGHIIKLSKGVFTVNRDHSVAVIGHPRYLEFSVEAVTSHRFRTLDLKTVRLSLTTRHGEQIQCDHAYLVNTSRSFDETDETLCVFAGHGAPTIPESALERWLAACTEIGAREDAGVIADMMAIQQHDSKRSISCT